MAVLLLIILLIGYLGLTFLYGMFLGTCIKHARGYQANED